MAAQSISRKTRIFISYSRKNKRFARKLNEALDKSGIEAWVDWEGIPPSAEWMQEVAAAIQASDAFVFIISPDSLKSKVCMEELELGIRYNKKIIPVVYCDAEKKQKIHPTLAALNWVYMRPRKEDFKSAVKLLTESIQTDLGWMHQHTRLLQRASEWEQKGRNPHYLLRGSDLSDSEAWLIESTKNTTRSVLPIQAEYINSSRKETMRRQRRFTIGVGLAMALSLFLGVFSLNQWRKAEENAALAKNNAATAIVSSNIAATQQARAEESELRALTNETIALAQRSAVQAGIYEARPGGLYTSALLALDSWRRFQTHEAEDILRQNLSRMASPVGQLRQEGAITGIGFSPDGERFFTSSDNGSVCVWTTAGERAYCVQHNGVLTKAQFSPLNDYLVTAGSDGFANLWNAQSGVPFQALEFSSRVLDMDISRNGKWLAVGLQEGGLAFVNFEKKKLELSFKLGSKGVVNTVFSPNSERLAFGLSNGQVTLWKVNSGSSQPGPKHETGAYKIEFSPDSNWVVSVGSDNTARAARSLYGGTKYVLSHNDRVRDLAFSPESAWFATASDDAFVRVFNTESGLEKIRMAQTDAVRVVAVSPNGQWLASTGRDGRALVWDAVSGTLMREIVLDAPGAALAFSPDNRLLITGDQEGNIGIWDISTLQAQAGCIEFPEIIHKAKFFPSGEWTLFNTDDKALWLIPADQLTALHDGRQGTKLLELDFPSSQTKVSPDSNWIAFTQNENKTANLYNVQSKTLHVLPHESAVSGIGFSGDGKRFATTREKGNSVYLWDVESGAPLEELKFDRTVFTLAFNPRGNSLAVGSSGRVILWNLENGTEITTLRQPGNIRSLNFSRNGRWLATTSSAGGILVWDMNQGAPALAYQFLQGNRITSLDFTADERLLASGGENGYAYLWDLTTGEERTRLPHNSSVSGVSFSPGGNLLVTVSHKAARVWDISRLETFETARIAESVCKKLQRNFSENEWEFFFPTEEYRLLCPDLPQG